jgi:hypothetical protein
MSSYYFPFGGAGATTVQNISHSLLAVTASVPVSSTVLALTALFAIDSGSTPPNGANGINQTPELCGPSTVVGPTGPTGERGPVGSDLTTCPPGTIECTQLNVSLSMALPGFPNGINTLRPSGSKFSRVCMQIPVGCTALDAVCPSFLPTASITAIFPAVT